MILYVEYLAELIVVSQDYASMQPPTEHITFLVRILEGVAYKYHFRKLSEKLPLFDEVNDFEIVGLYTCRDSYFNLKSFGFMRHSGILA